MNILFLILIGISLSMDTFSLSLSLGTFEIKKRDCVLFSCVVGLFHFFMPLLGTLIGNSIQKFIIVNPNKLLAIILIFIAIEMLLDLKEKDDKDYDFRFINMLVYAFSVSIDSLTIGIGLSGITNNSVIASVIFMGISSLFTYTGLQLGNYSRRRLGKLANYIGIAIIVLLAIIQLFK